MYNVYICNLKFDKQKILIMEKENAIRKYTNGEVTVIWEAGKCIHAAECVGNLPEVFNTKARPWIQPENASSADLVNTVRKCPSGALTIEGDQ